MGDRRPDPAASQGLKFPFQPSDFKCVSYCIQGMVSTHHLAFSLLHHVVFMIKTIIKTTIAFLLTYSISETERHIIPEIIQRYESHLERHMEGEDIFLSAPIDLDGAKCLK